MRFELRCVCRVVFLTPSCPSAALQWDHGTGDSYLTFVQLLHASRGLTIDGKPLQIWADLIPPSESPRFNHSQCSVPADSPLTDFNELALFDLTDGLRGCTDCETFVTQTWTPALDR